MALTVVVLGGYGGAGRHICALLAQHIRDVQIVVAGRNVREAQRLCNALNAQHPTPVAKECYADASKAQTLLDAFRGARVVVNAMATSKHVQAVTMAAMESGADYVDILANAEPLDALRGLMSGGKYADRVALTQAGVSPGIVATLISYAAAQVAVPHDVEFGILMHGLDVQTVEGCYDLVDSLTETPELYERGKWRSAGLWEVSAPVDYGPRWGSHTSYAVKLEELHGVAPALNLHSLTCRYAGLPWLAALLVLPLTSLCYSIRRGLLRHQLARLMKWTLHVSDPGDHTVCMRCQVSGPLEDISSGGRAERVVVQLEHPDVYVFTGACVVAAVQQVLSGAIKPTGAPQLAALAMHPAVAMQQLEDMGASLTKC